MYWNNSLPMQLFQITVRAPLTTAVIIQKKNSGQQGAATNQERLQFKKKFWAKSGHF